VAPGVLLAFHLVWSLEVVKLLLATGKADPDAKDEDGRTPLSRAGTEEVVKLLLATDKVDPNAKDKGGRTPLSRGLAMGVKTMVELFSATGQVQETQNKSTTRYESTNTRY